MIILYGPGSEQIGLKTARLLDVEGSAVEHIFFPDGESHLRIPREVKGHDVVLVHSTGPPQDTRLVQLLLLVDAIRDMGMRSMVVVTPYLAYARQDRRRLQGEAVSILTVIKLLRALGISKLVTVNVHNPEVFNGSGLELQDLSAIPLLAQYFRDRGLVGAFSLSLGKKAVDLEHAREADSILGGGYSCLRTFRDPYTGEVTLEKGELSAKGQRVVVFDDVITSGSTHLKTVELMRERGAEEVYLACVHSLLSEERLGRVIEAVDDFICTDTVPNRFSRVNVAPVIAEALRQDHSHSVQYVKKPNHAGNTNPN